MPLKIDYEDLITKKHKITLSREGYIRRLPIDTFKAQNRVARVLLQVLKKKTLEQIFTASTHSYLLILLIKAERIDKVYRLPEGTRMVRVVQR